MSKIIYIAIGSAAAYILYNYNEGFKNYIDLNVFKSQKPDGFKKNYEKEVELDLENAHNKFIKEFSPEKLIEFNSKIESLFKVIKLIHNADVKGVFEGYIQPSDWSEFAREVYNNSIGKSISIIQSLNTNVVEKIFGLSTKYLDYCTTSFDNEYIHIMESHGLTLEEAKTNLKIFKLQNGDSHDMQFGSTDKECFNSLEQIKFTDDERLVINTVKLISDANLDMESFNTRDKLLVKSNFNSFVSDNIPELHDTLWPSEY